MDIFKALNGTIGCEDDEIQCQLCFDPEANSSLLVGSGPSKCYFFG